LKQEIEIWKSSNKEAVQLWKDKTKEIESLKKQLEETQNAFNNNYNELMELAAHAKDLEKQLEEWKALAEAADNMVEAYQIWFTPDENRGKKQSEFAFDNFLQSAKKYNELKSQMIK
jgi:peptidoglycan hydrolase CwlO-like protein